MGKIYNALERAGKEFEASRHGAVDHSGEELWLPPRKKAPASVSPNGWVELQNKLLSRYPQRPIRTLMFSGINHGIGVTTAVVNFSRAMVRNSARKVLIIDANLRTPNLHSLFNLDPADGLAEILAGNGIKVLRFNKVGEGELYAMTCGCDPSEIVGRFETKPFDALLETAIKKFDFTILDSAPITRYSETQAISPRVDGVVLVIEAGKTRQQVALRAKKELEDAGGKLLGVILNKRRYYIPNWIYKHL